MRRPAAVLFVFVVVVGGCSGDDDNGEAERASTTTTTLHLPERLPELAPVARTVLERGVPEPVEDYDLLLRTCIQLQRAAAAAAAAPAGAPERGGLDDAQVAAAREAAELCRSDPKAAAAKLP